MLEITSAKNGAVRQIEIAMFAALEGWDIQRKYVEFAASKDKAFRKQFTLEILEYATVIFNGHRIPLTTSALIDNHLESWENVQLVFEEVLSTNGIDPKTHANQPQFWSDAGEEMAVAFIAAATKLIGPAMQVAEGIAKQNNGA